MSRDETQLRCDIVEVGRRLYARGLIGGHEGNVSVRLDTSILITRSPSKIQVPGRDVEPDFLIRHESLPAP